MKKYLLSLFFIISCVPAFAQVQVTRDELPNFTTTDSTAVANNILRQNQNAINAIGGYFNSNEYLTEANGGTGTNLSAVPNGSILIQSTANVGIGTFGQGTSGQIVTSNGVGVPPSFQNPAAQTSQVFTSSGSFTAPAGVTKVYISMVAAGGGGAAKTGGVGGGAASGQWVLSYPYTVIPGNSYTVTIGIGGNGFGSGAGDGTAGGNSSFDTLTVLGGNPGLQTGAGGAASRLNFAGIAGANQVGGGPAMNSAGGGTTVGGSGGGTPFGNGGASAVDVNNSAGPPTVSSGAGGGGNGQNGTASAANGANGLCVVMY